MAQIRQIYTNFLNIIYVNPCYLCVKNKNYDRLHTKI